MKIALVLAPSWGIESPHLGIALLSAALRKRGHTVEVFDFNLRVHKQNKEKGWWKGEEDLHWEDANTVGGFIRDNEELLKTFAQEIYLSRAQVVSFSVYNTTWMLSLELANRIKDVDKNKFIVFGGQRCFPELAAEGLIKHAAVDAVVLGEGEEVLPELLGKIEKLKRIEFCPGIFYKEKGEVINCGRRPAIANIDALTYPDFSDFSLAEYGNPHQLPILASRGCPYPCIFCSTKLFWVNFRCLSGARIFKEMDFQLHRHPGVSFFTFNDHVINADMQALSDFCDLVLAAKQNQNQDNPWKGLNWRGAVVIREEMDAPFLAKMKAAGCIELEYGLESASLAVRKLMRKPPYDIQVLERVITDTHNSGINARVNFMFGFPGETEEDFQETLNFLKKNRAAFAQVHASETFCHVDPGTYLFEHLSEAKISEKKFHPLYWESQDGKNKYPERLRRHQEFCQLAVALNIPLSSGGHKIMLHKEHFLKKYEENL